MCLLCRLEDAADFEQEKEELRNQITVNELEALANGEEPPPLPDGVVSVPLTIMKVDDDMYAAVTDEQGIKLLMLIMNKLGFTTPAP